MRISGKSYILQAVVAAQLLPVSHAVEIYLRIYSELTISGQTVACLRDGLLTTPCVLLIRLVRDSRTWRLWDASCGRRTIRHRDDGGWSGVEEQEWKGREGKVREVEHRRIWWNCPIHVLSHSITMKRELYATLLLSNFHVHWHTEVTPVVTHISSARPPAPLRTRHTNRLNPGNNEAVRCVQLPHVTRNRASGAKIYFVVSPWRNTDVTPEICVTRFCRATLRGHSHIRSAALRTVFPAQQRAVQYMWTALRPNARAFSSTERYYP